ncbi:MAG: hypothetical protein ACLPKT_23695, partial [Methylocella sp.]
NVEVWPAVLRHLRQFDTWILERNATVYEKRICTSLPSSLRIAWNERDVGISFETGALFIRYWLMATPSLP